MKMFPTFYNNPLLLSIKNTVLYSLYLRPDITFTRTEDGWDYHRLCCQTVRLTLPLETLAPALLPSCSSRRH